MILYGICNDPLQPHTTIYILKQSWAKAHCAQVHEKIKINQKPA